MAVFSENKYTQIAAVAVNYWNQYGRTVSLKPHMIRAVNEANSNLQPEQFREAMAKLGKILGSRRKERKGGNSKRIRRKPRPTVPSQKKGNAELINSAYSQSQKEIDDMHKKPDPKPRQGLFFFNPDVK